MTPTRATSILFKIASHNIKAINGYFHSYLVDELTDRHMEDLRKVLSYVNRYSDENNSCATVLSTVVGDIHPTTRKLYELVEDFLRAK
ncbi:hypothetical protein ACQKMI_12480 [Lysinibacillus sp. NPDC097214]|uniref:hypothetical protein n=1 Tax=Lysinibacillus sp. NPDC097214 TaxID=3390584 RepID=UPI003D07677B